VWKIQTASAKEQELKAKNEEQLAISNWQLAQLKQLQAEQAKGKEARSQKPRAKGQELLGKNREPHECDTKRSVEENAGHVRQ
jgi:hypothetical protein